MFESPRNVVQHGWEADRCEARVKHGSSDKEQL